MVKAQIPLTFCLPLFLSTAKGQDVPPIGSWREHLPFNNALQVAEAGNDILCATPFGFFRYTNSDGTFSRLTKINGLSEVRVRKMAPELPGNRVVLVYENGNIDLVDGNRVRNIPDLMLSSVPGDKTCHAVLW